ncbi:transaminase [Pseudofrankia inefficax]|uniref:Aminotransferase class-III n=1 Tax=Pseudofrankia inefficax (strain DSM 45817 / CECT 9037 / DDB 130130 / EuI1c) TaxID=298654 RepID=E3J1T7_PSEI1|nr:transaminase [Pseudofrankia inefficax]ADP82895.1 aminotransferase class-III [Pseudofrankia inefficax]
MAGVDRDRLARLLDAETARFVTAHPQAGKAFERARGSQLSGVPMNWMTRWPGSYPVVVAAAAGSRLTDVDGHGYVDFCLGDTGAMAGHCPAPTVAAVTAQAASAITTMLPSADAPAVSELLRDRFGLPLWQFTLTATDANRFVLRLAREITGRPKVLVFDHCYHGTVDETAVTLDDQGGVVARPGSLGPQVDPARTTRVVQFNDLAALEHELAHGDVACVLAEPALTNIGIVLPDEGFHASLRALCDEHGTLLVIDETHTICAGPGGYTAAHGLRPDFLTIGKPIAGGIPIGAYGMTADVAAKVLEHDIPRLTDVNGIGGTLAANPVSFAAARATLAEVLTPAAFDRMISLAERFEAGTAGAFADIGLGWQTVRLGCRVEYMSPVRDTGTAAGTAAGWRAARTGAEASAAFDEQLDAYLHLALLNRGVLMTPFHMMALMSPATTEADVDAHTTALRDALDALAG